MAEVGHPYPGSPVKHKNSVGTGTTIVFIIKNHFMIDDQQGIVQADDLLSLNPQNDFQDWAKRAGVNRDQFRKAIRAVGNNAKRVEKYLKNNSRHNGTINHPLD